MSTFAIVQRCVRVQDGAWNALVKIEGLKETVFVLVRVPDELPEGRRLTIEGAGALWKLAA